MNILFVHNNFPGQYLHLVRALAYDPEIRMAAIGSGTSQTMDGVKRLRYSLGHVDVAATYPFARRSTLSAIAPSKVLFTVILSNSGNLNRTSSWPTRAGARHPLRTIFSMPASCCTASFSTAHTVVTSDLTKNFPKPASMDMSTSSEKRVQFTGPCGLQCWHFANQMAAIDFSKRNST